MRGFLDSVRKNIVDVSVTLGLTAGIAVLMAYTQLVRLYSWADMAFFFSLYCAAPALLMFAVWMFVRNRDQIVAMPEDSTLTLPGDGEVKYVRDGEWLKILADNYNPRKRRLQVPIGFDDSGNPVELSMRGSESHLSVIGMTGTGKSVLVNQFLVTAAMTGNYQVVIITRTKKDYTKIEDMPNIHVLDYGSGFSAAESRQVYAKSLPVIFDSVLEEMVRRQNYLQKKGVSSVYAKKLRPDERPSNLIIVIEEFINAVDMIGLLQSQQEKNRFLGQVQAGVQEFRAVGMKLVVVGQKASGSIPQSVLQQMTAVTLRVGSSQESFWATGRKKINAHELRVVDNEDNPKISSEILLTGTKSGTRRCNMPLTSDATIEAAVGMFRDEIRTYPPPSWIHDYGRIAQPVKALPDKDSPVTHTRIKPSPVTAHVATPRLSARMVSEFAGMSYDRNKVFAEWRDGLKRAYTRERAVMSMLMLHSGATRTATVEHVFGGRNSDRYRFIDTCESEYNRLKRAWAKKYRKGVNVQS
jgi:hypothetical protein